MTTHHSFDRPSRRYLGPCPIPASILDPVNGSAAPANTLPIEPPTPSENEAVLVNEAFDNWELVPDFTGTVYQKADGEPVEYKELGPLPDHLTPLARGTKWDNWNEPSGQWTTDTSARQKELCQQYCSQLDAFASTVRARFISGGDNTTLEYQRAGEVAEVFKAAGFSGEIPSPIQSHMDAYGEDAETATNQILSMATLSNQALDAVRAIRLPGKEAIKALPIETTEEQFKAEYKNWYDQLDAIQATF